MQVAIHFGVHCTDEDRLLRTLLSNKGNLAPEGICVPGPGRYRENLAEAMEKLRGAEASKEATDVLIEAMVDDDTTTRIVLSDEEFLCRPSEILARGRLYDTASYKPMWLRNIFAGHDVEFFIGLRNPATLLPAAFKLAEKEMPEFSEFLHGADLGALRWSDTIETIRDANPDTPLTVWSNEDTLLIWPEVMQALSGHAPETRVKGTMVLLGHTMQKEGIKRLKAYLQTHPPQDAIQRRRILSAFLEKYAIPDEVEEELDAPGWTDALVCEMTQAYEEDLKKIEAMPGVRFLTP